MGVDLTAFPGKFIFDMRIFPFLRFFFPHVSLVKSSVVGDQFQLLQNGHPQTSHQFTSTFGGASSASSQRRTQWWLLYFGMGTLQQSDLAKIPCLHRSDPVKQMVWDFHRFPVAMFDSLYLNGCPALAVKKTSRPWQLRQPVAGEMELELASFI